MTTPRRASSSIQRQKPLEAGTSANIGVAARGRVERRVQRAENEDRHLLAGGGGRRAVQVGPAAADDATAGQLFDPAAEAAGRPGRR